MKRLTTLVILSLLSLAAYGDTLKGKVLNGTTQKPAAGDVVQLKKPSPEGMQDIAETKTNAKGEFTFQSVDLSAQYVVWVKHQNVLFSESVRENNPEIKVYDVAPKVQGAEQTDESLILQADNSGLRVMELVTVVNNSDPPKAQPNFEIYLPEGAKVLEGSAGQQDKMPLRRAPVPSADDKTRYVFNYPVRPGETRFDLTYDLPYNGKMDFDPKLSGPVGKLFIVMPKSLRFTPAAGAAYTHSEEWEHAPQLKGIDVQIAKDAKPGDKLAFQLEGIGVFPRDNADAGQGEDTRPGGGLGVPNERPDPISAGAGGQWAFLGVLTFFLAGGAAFLFITARTAALTPAPVRPAGSAPLLDALKEEMFQLETDRLHGKVTTQEYEAAKSALDKTLQRAMKRKK